MVEDAVAGCAPGLALASVPSGLAGNGCGGVLGCESACTAASARRVAPGDLQNDPRHDSALGRDAIHSARGTPSARVGGYVGTHPAPSFRYFRNRRTLLAKRWRQCKSYNVCAPTSLGEFWGKRWNLGFRQLSHELIFRPLHRRLGADAAGFLVFAVSGLIHDLVISLPARGGYGLPTLYFLLQGTGMTISQFGKRLGLGRGAPGWSFMMVFLSTPVFLLFHPWFVMRVILPFMQAIHAL
jgi:hypothetical protein